jgi:TadE-like protein
MRGPNGSLVGDDTQRGSVTVEVAVALPALVLVVAIALWGVSVAAAHVACVDAARAGARAAARGEPPPAVRAAVLRGAPSGARVATRRDGDVTEVDVSVVLRAPALSGLPQIVVHEHAVAATEPGVGAP